MHTITRISFVALAAALTACGGGASNASPPQGTLTANVRFVNVSPDAGIADPSNSQNEFILFSNTAAQVTVDGTQVTTLAHDSSLSANSGTTPNAPSITAYTSIPAASHTVAFVDPSAFTATGFLQLTTTLQPMKPGSYYTVLLAGSYCLGTLTFYQFADTQTTSGRVVMYNVAPDAPGSVQFGTFPAAAGAPLSPLGTAGPGARSEGAASGNNIGAYAGTGGAFRILPSAVSSFDTSNAVPFNALTTFSLFYRDGIPQNASSVHCSDKSATPAFLQGAMTN